MLGPAPPATFVHLPTSPRRFTFGSAGSKLRLYAALNIWTCGGVVNAIVTDSHNPYHRVWELLQNPDESRAGVSVE